MRSFSLLFFICLTSCALLNKQVDWPKRYNVALPNSAEARQKIDHKFAKRVKGNLVMGKNGDVYYQIDGDQYHCPITFRPKGIRFSVYRNCLVIEDTRGYKFVDRLWGEVGELMSANTYVIMEPKVLSYELDWVANFIGKDWSGSGLYLSPDELLKKKIVPIFMQEASKEGQTRYGAIHYKAKDSRTSIFYKGDDYLHRGYGFFDPIKQLDRGREHIIIEVSKRDAFWLGGYRWTLWLDSGKKNYKMVKHEGPVIRGLTGLSLK